MEEAAFIRAILDEPEDDTPRLVFADWLQDHGQEARAEWIRASCAMARSDSDDPDFGELVDREYQAFRRCRPAWWERVTGVSQVNDRGMFRFGVRSKTAAARLGKVRWLGQAVAEGWLEAISVEWCDGSVARVIAGWPAEAREAPLFVRPAPQIGDEWLASYLRWVPRLWGLDVAGYATRNPSIRLLGERSDLRELRLDGMPADEDVAAVFEQIGRLSGLRRLTLRGYQTPTDEHLAALGGLSRLRELHLDGCVTVTDAGLAPLRRMKNLRLLRLWGCAGISDAAVAELRQALPALHVERL